MHTLQARCGTVFNHNGDFSGDAIVSIGGISVTVPIDDLLEFVAEFVRYRKIQQLEEASAEMLLLHPIYEWPGIEPK